MGRTVQVFPNFYLFLLIRYQVVPHVTDEIQRWIQSVAVQPVDGTNNPPDFCIIELGGTIGDIEGMPFVEALRQFQFKIGKGNLCCSKTLLFHLIN